MLRIGLTHGDGLIVATAALLLSFVLPAASPPILADNTGAPWMEAVKPNDILFTPIGHTGGPVQSAAALGRYVLAGAGNQLLVFDTLISARLRLVFESPALPEQIEGITIAGQYAYVLAGSAGLFIYDLAEPKAPVLVASLSLLGTARDAAVSGSYAYVAAGPAGLRIIDVSDVTQPVEVGFFDNPAYDILNVAVEGQYAYVTGGQSGLHVLDVSDPVAPSEATSLDLSGTAKGIAILSDHAYIAARDAGLRVVDISNPLQPVEVGSSGKTGPEDAHDVVVVGNYAYVADRSVWTGEYLDPGGMRTVDVSSPVNPISVSNLTGDVWAIAVWTERAYIANYDPISGNANSLDVVSLDDPAEPQPVSRFALPASIYSPMVTSGRSLYLVNQGLTRMDLVNPEQPRLVWNLQLPGDTYFPGALTGLAISGDYAYVGAGSAGLHVVDLHFPQRPRRVVTLDHEAYDVVARGNLAFISELYGGLSLVDISDPTAPTVISTITGNWSVSDMKVVGDYLYVANYAFPSVSALLIYDISNPTNPVQIGSFNTGAESPRHVEVNGKWAYLGVGTLSGILVIIDISDPTNPQYVSQLEFPVYFSDMTLAAGHILVTLPSIPNGGLRAIDVSNPTQPRVDGQYILSKSFTLAVAALPGQIVTLGTSQGLGVLRATIASQ